MGNQRIRVVNADTTEELEKEVNKLIDEGYELFGNLNVSAFTLEGKVYYFYVQVMNFLY
jgi:hypothetical protein